MCGIAGIYGKPDTQALERMLASIQRRGPDAQGIWGDTDTCALGMRRLAILDTSVVGNQPMHSPCGLVTIVYNGETYNFPELRKQLVSKGHQFTSRTDTEVVLRLYEEMGDACLDHLDGMFALAIYDRRQGPGKERLLLARDPIGIKPLLWTVQNGRLIFASEMKALLASGLVARNLDPGALWLLLHRGSVPQPMTMLRDVQMLMPGHKLVATRNGITAEPYWRFADLPVGEAAHRAPEEMAAWLRHTFRKTIAAQSISDVPVGAWLSGGIDSAISTAFLAETIGSRLRTFSLGMDPAEADGCFDETPLAEQSAQFIGTQHQSFHIGGALMAACFDDFVTALDQPSVDGVNSYFISRFTKQHVTVTLSGTGGDELFAGYPWFTAMQQAQGIGNPDFALHFGQQYFIMPPEVSLQLVAPDRLGRIADPAALFVQTATRPDELPQAGPVERTSVLCLRSYTQNQLLRDIDTVSMHHSLEVRVPFLGIPVIKAAMALPAAAKLSPHARPDAATYRAAGSKGILFAIAAGLVPPDIIDRPKRGFALPFRNWLLGPLRQRAEETLLGSDVDGAMPVLRQEEVRRIWRAFIADRLPWSYPWLLLVLRTWLRANHI